MPLTRTQKTIIALIVSLAMFMEALDATIINTAIPAMAHSLLVNPIDLKIALISYLLSLAIFIPVSGWIADKFGVKTVFIAALGLFTMASLWCGYAQTLTELVIARSIQGMGGAFMSPVGRLILLRTFKRHEMVEAMNTVIMVVSIGLMLGPLAGGLITDHLSWHWIFWVNMPVGLFAMLMSLLFLEKAPPVKVRSFDFLGFVLFGGGLAMLTFALSDFSETTASTRGALVYLSISVLMLIGYFLHSNQEHHPIIKTDLFKIRTFSVSVFGNIFCRLGFSGTPFLLPLLLQVGMGYSAQLSGLLVAPVALGVLVVKIKSFSLRLLRLLGYRRLLLMNTFCIIGALWSLLVIGVNTPYYVIALLNFGFGTFAALQYSSMNSLGYADLPNSDLSAATSIMSTQQQLAQSFGVALSALLLRYYSPQTISSFNLHPAVFHQVFLTMGLITFFAVLIFMQLKPDDGHQMLEAPSEKKEYEKEI